MSMRLFAMTCGWLTAPLGAFLEGESGQLRVPVPCYLIDHPKGTVLFDSGLHIDTQKDPHARLGPLARVFEVEFQPGEELAARIASLGVDVGEISFLMNSHLHFDHTGGNAQVPNARLVVQQREWTAGRDSYQIEANSYDPRDYDLGHDVLAVDGEYDLFGDGRIVCIPTSGHTPGHQSLLLHLEQGEVVLAADACYLRRTLDELHLPPVVHDRDAMRASLLRLRELRAGGARIFYGHDPEFWASISEGPTAPVY